MPLPFLLLLAAAPLHLCRRPSALVEQTPESVLALPGLTASVVVQRLVLPQATAMAIAWHQASLEVWHPQAAVER